jgi:hypothetical protein
MIMNIPMITGIHTNTRIPTRDTNILMSAPSTVIGAERDDLTLLTAY